MTTTRYSPTCPICGTGLFYREEGDTFVFNCPKEKEHSLWRADRLPFEIGYEKETNADSNILDPNVEPRDSPG